MKLGDILKEAVSPAQQAAIAISKKERGEKPMKEVAPPGREKQVKGLKKAIKKSEIDKTYIDKKTGKRKKANPYALAYAQANKYGKPKSEATLDNDKQQILEIAFFMSMNPNQLNENIGSSIMRAAKKAGLNIKGSGGRGLISILSKTSKYMGQVMYYAFKAHGGDKEARVKLKELLQKRVSREELFDFLLKLDAVTFSAITGPINIIDAIMGWSTVANIRKSAVKVDDRITNAIDSLLSSAEDLPDKIRRRVITNISKLKKIVGV